MDGEVITQKSMDGFIGLVILGLAIFPPGGALLGRAYLSLGAWDLVQYILYFFGLPVLVAAIAFLLGWWFKKGTSTYNEPEWKFEAVKLTLEDAKKLPSTYNRKYHRLVANSNYWMFFIPVGLITLAAAIPPYIVFELPWLGAYIEIIIAVLLALLYISSILGGYLATSSSASEDFTLPLIREALRLADKQKKLPGISSISIVMDRAEHEGFKIYDEPRVLIRIQDLEKESYIETWSGEVNSIERMLLRIYQSDDHPQIIWWWVSHDRMFRKYSSPEDKGYYVKYPVKSPVKQIGVKDVEVLTANGIAIVIREWIHTRGSSPALEFILEALNSELV